MKTKLLLSFGVFLTVLVNSSAQTINPGIIDPTDTYAGKTYSRMVRWFGGNIL